MKDFITYDLISDLGRSSITTVAKKVFPGFLWREGDSDTQGLYISGSDENHVTIQIWLSEKPIEMFVSFRSAWESDTDRYNKKSKLIQLVETDFIPSIGMNIKKSEVD